MKELEVIKVITIKMFSCCLISLASQNLGLLSQFSEEIKSFLNQIILTKDTYENLIENTDILKNLLCCTTKRRSSFYYDLISGKFYITGAWGDVQARLLLEYYTSVWLVLTILRVL